MGDPSKEVWTAVDHYTGEHLKPGIDGLEVALSYAQENSASHNLPPISVSPAHGKFLQLQARVLGVKNILEVGTLGAYSTIWLANAAPDVTVTTIEVNEAHAAVARDNLKNAGLANRVEVIVGSAVDVFPRLIEEVSKGIRKPFGLIFIDADKENNWYYFENSIKISVPRTLIIVDNVVRNGTLINDTLAKEDSRIRGAREVIEKAGKDERVDSVVLQTVGEKSYDGFLISVVK
ncbi:hypothetical protein HK096_004522 [Nowakowskiella sp. JEL0078]|nr:hypothetical protein HK096_004522 [Nowakowskiella sp. JEL0078]